MEKHGHFIDGKWIGSNDSLVSINPATLEPIGSRAIGTEDEVRTAVTAARDALDSWRATPLKGRAEVLRSVAQHIRSNLDQIAGLISTEVGKPLFEARIEARKAAGVLDFFADEARVYLEGRMIPVDEGIFPSKICYTKYEPLGVVAVIKPWNFPFSIPFWSIAPALAAGNTVVFKPSELAPFTGVEIARLFEASGSPNGILNVVTGNEDTGRILVKSDVDMVSFTGSIATGEEIANESGRLLRPVSLELGGKDAFVVCADANLEAAVNGAAWAAFSNCGQVCISAERFFVSENLAEEFVSKLSNKAKQLRIGHGMDPSTDIGPMASEEQLKKVELHIEDALQKGARAVAGGARAKVDGFPKGLFYKPTVLTNVDPQMLVMTEETFGPVAPVMTIQDDDEAIRLANDCMYGLGASIWTRNIGKAYEMANKLRAGIISINDAIVSFPQCPWGGMKKSGIGRELSIEGLREYTVVKHIAVEYGDRPSRSWWFPYS